MQVNTIQTKSASFSSTTAQLFSGRVKVWWNYAQRTGPAITNSFNVSSITDNATGQYIVNFSVTLDKPSGSVAASYDTDAFNSAYSDNANLYATNTTASVMTPNIGVSGAAFGNLHDCDFNYGVIVD
tara:strand:- start:210 stop:590 length:381 start_codon:yes stop_codon:yes gene_type:complete